MRLPQLSEFSDLYRQLHLKGDSLVHPLRSYRDFFVSKGEESEGIAQLAWRVVHLVTGIFAYPLFGALASIGMTLKWIDADNIRLHNLLIETILDHNIKELKLCENETARVLPLTPEVIRDVKADIQQHRADYQRYCCNIFKRADGQRVIQPLPPRDVSAFSFELDTSEVIQVRIESGSESFWRGLNGA